MTGRFRDRMVTARCGLREDDSRLSYCVREINAPYPLMTLTHRRPGARGRLRCDRSRGQRLSVQAPGPQVLRHRRTGSPDGHALCLSPALAQRPARCRTGGGSLRHRHRRQPAPAGLRHRHSAGPRCRPAVRIAPTAGAGGSAAPCGRSRPPPRGACRLRPCGGAAGARFAPYARRRHSLCQRAGGARHRPRAARRPPLVSGARSGSAGSGSQQRPRRHSPPRGVRRKNPARPLARSPYRPASSSWRERDGVARRTPPAAGYGAPDLPRSHPAAPGGADAGRLRGQCEPRTAHPARLPFGFHRNAARAGPQRHLGTGAVPRHHGRAGPAHVAPDRRPALPVAHRTQRSHAPGDAGRGGNDRRPCLRDPVPACPRAGRRAEAGADRRTPAGVR